MRRMPALLGRASGPRNIPRSKQHLTYAGDNTRVTAHALTDAAMLSRYLPPRCHPVGEPILSVTITQLTKLGWLAGRGYNLINVSTKVVFEGENETVRGDFSLCLWENKADPIVTGRDELGMPKLFVDIPDPRELDGRWECSASWEGFPFLHLNVDTNADGKSGPSPDAYRHSGVYILHRYQARTGQWDQADVDHIVVGHATTAPQATVLDKRTGIGRFEFRQARWEDMPTQYTYVNALAELPLLEFRGGEVVKATGVPHLQAFHIAR
jgi:hypothetical protein